MGPNLGPIYPPQKSRSPPFSPGGHCFFKTKKHVKPLIYKHFTRFYWRRHPDSNWGIKILQTFALPLGYGALKNGAVDEARTRDLHLGKVALYQLSYYRIKGALGRNRTTDTVIFSHMLYQLSYQGKYGDPEGARTLDLQRDRLAF